MRVMGLDYGSKTVGVAVSDPFGWTAQAVETIWRRDENKLRKTLSRIDELVKAYEIQTIVLGFPQNMDGTIGERAQKTLEWKEKLERRTGLPVVLWDERLTTVSAAEILTESGVKRENQKKYVDQVAAGLILQEYLDACRAKKDAEGRLEHESEEGRCAGLSDRGREFG